MRFQQAPYRIADVVALLFILHGNTSFGSLAPIIPYRSCKHYLERSKDAFVIHHREDRKRVYPLWVAIEVATFDMVSKLYKNLLPNDRAAIAKKYYGISSRECIENWLQCAVVARNVAAHGGRFYNRVGLNPAVKLSPKHQKEFSGTRPFGYVYAIYKLLPEDRKLSMLNDISKLFRKHPFALPKHLGFPENWQELIIE